MSDTTNSKRRLTLEEATSPTIEEASADVKAWQDAKVRAAVKAADAGEFASPEELKATVRKYVPHG